MIFRKLGWVSKFCENFSNYLIGLSPISCLCICVGPLWQIELVLRHFSSCSSISHCVYILCMLDVWQNVQVTFFGCIGRKWVPLLEFILVELVSHALDGFNSFCASMPCLAHTVNIFGIYSPPPPPMHHVLHTHALLLIHVLCLCFMINSLVWCLSLFTLFLSKLCSVFRLFLFGLWTNLNLIKFCVLSCVSTLGSFLFVFLCTDGSY